MKKDKAEDMRAEYDFSTMAGGVRGKYRKAFLEGTNVVLLEPDVAKAFPSAAAVNEALRKLIANTDEPSVPAKAEKS